MKSPRIVSQGERTEQTEIVFNYSSVLTERPRIFCEADTNPHHAGTNRGSTSNCTLSWTEQVNLARNLSYNTASIFRELQQHEIFAVLRGQDSLKTSDTMMQLISRSKM